MKKLAGIGSVLSILGLAACGHAGVSGRATARMVAPQLPARVAGVVVEEYSVKPLILRHVAIRASVAGKSGKAALSSKFSLVSPREAMTGGSNGSRTLQGRGLASEQGPYTNGKKGTKAMLSKRMMLRNRSLATQLSVNASGKGKKGTLAMLNKGMLLKSGALQNSKAIHVGKRGKKGSFAMLNKAMLLKSGALENTKAINVGGHRKGRVSQLNITMMIKGGAMARDDAIRTHRQVRIHAPDVALHKNFHVRNLSRVPRARVRRPLGGRCFGTNCDD